MARMQTESLHGEIDALQLMHGDLSLCAIYGAGCVDGPRAMLVFMNPTARNVSAAREWQGLRAPWLGTRDVWGMLAELGMLPHALYEEIRVMQPADWTADFADRVYAELARQGIFVTNLAKCTQPDARPLGNAVYREYLEVMKSEIALVRPQRIIAFGNQVSSVLLGRPVSVSAYAGERSEPLLVDGEEFRVYPTWYPVGQGRRNMPLAVTRIRQALGS